MAKRVIQELIDDLDGKPADESVTFGLDGVQYSIDLSKKNAEKLRAALKPYISAGTKVGRSASAGARTAPGRGSRHHTRRPRPEPRDPGMGAGRRIPGFRPRTHQAGHRRPVPRLGRPVNR